MNLRQTALCATFVATWFLLPSSSSAQGGAAEALFREGRELLQAGKISEACAKFDASNQLDRQLGTQLNLAMCHQREGKTATAWSDFASVASQTGDAERARFAREQREVLEKSLSRVRFQVPPEARILVLDGKDLPRGAWSSALPLDPGRHRATVDDAETQFDVPAGPSEQTVDLRSPATRETVAPPVAPAAVGGRSGQGRRVVGYTLVGVGALGLGIGTVFGLKALSSKSDVEADCAGRFCRTPGGIEAADDARSSGHVSTVALLVGGAALVAGVALVLWPSSRAPATAAAWRERLLQPLQGVVHF